MKSKIEKVVLDIKEYFENGTGSKDLDFAIRYIFWIIIILAWIFTIGLTNERNNPNIN